jgi:beta-glucanase (GH16 family)
MLKERARKTTRFLYFLMVVGFIFPSSACSDDAEEINFEVDFSYELIDDNHVRIVNQSAGEYYLLDWDFGNGETEANAQKSKAYEIYYPLAGDYEVTLTIVGMEGDRKSTSQKVTIDQSDLVLSFTADIDASNPNSVSLENTSVGNYDSFKWIFRNIEVAGETNTVAYFPYSGEYDIELEIVKGSNVFSHIESVNIGQDDPDYVSSFTLSWSDEFDGASINTNDWTFETGASGWGNNELQNYTNGNNAKIEDGKLILTVKKLNDNQGVGSYSSTRMISKGKKEFTYGKMEIRAKLPSGRGIWPAIWMLGGNIGSVSWPACGEIDVMEYVGYQPNTIHATVHTTAGSGANGNGSSKTLETAEEEFHIYGLIWTEKEMIFYTDSPENVTHTYSPSNKTDDNWPFYKPQFFILNVAVGGNWGGAQGIDNTIFPQTMEVDYIRVYQETLNQ